MTLKITLLTLAALTMGAVGQAATYHVTLLKPTVIAGQELKPGDYKVEVNNNTAVISHGKHSVEANVKTVDVDKKYDSTVIKYEIDGNKYKLREIGIGGSKIKLILNDGAALASPIS